MKPLSPLAGFNRLASRNGPLRALTTTALALLLCGIQGTLAQPRTEFVTNRLERVLATLSTHAIDTPCPECGGPDHHEIRVQSVALFDQVSVRLSTASATNLVFDHYGPTNVVVRTNVVLRLLPPLSPYSSPGWPANPASK